MNNKLKEIALKLKEPNFNSSYSREDCIFLLKDISSLVEETPTNVKESMINKGINYSEMLPQEELPSDEYLNIFTDGLKNIKSYLANLIQLIAEEIYLSKGNNLVLVSLARAGSPIGILIKRYIKMKYKVDIPHYSVSIIRGKGFDTNALAYILSKHENCNIQFVDGWTGKGAIGKELTASCKLFNKTFDTSIDDSLAVIADPSGTAKIYGTRDDIFIPNCCLNATVSGLISRTFIKENIIGEYDFHGAKFYKEWINHDYSNYFVEEITDSFSILPFDDTADCLLPADFQGNKEVKRIKHLLGITDSNKIKPSIGETTRVLLRRVPECILIKNPSNPHIQHIAFLALSKNICMKVIPDMHYECVGIIK